MSNLVHWQEKCHNLFFKLRNQGTCSTHWNLAIQVQFPLVKLKFSTLRVDEDPKNAPLVWVLVRLDCLIQSTFLQSSKGYTFVGHVLQKRWQVNWDKTVLQYWKPAGMWKVSLDYISACMPVTTLWLSATEWVNGNVCLSLPMKEMPGHFVHSHSKCNCSQSLPPIGAVFEKSKPCIILKTEMAR